MNETTIRDLLHQVMDGTEPPPGPHVLGNAVRAASRNRRRQRAAAIGAAAVAVPSLAVGAPAVVGALSPAAPASHPGSVTAAGAAGARHPAKKTIRHAHRSSVRSKYALVFERPARLVTKPAVNPVPITRQTLGQLLIDDLPSGSHTSQVEADPDFNAVGTAYAWFNNVGTPVGAGELEVTMMPVGSKAFDFGCGSDSATCHDYRLPGGVVVSEQYQLPTGAGILLNISVFRPNAVELDISEGNGAMAAGSPETKAMPLTVRQMLRIALDERWQFTVSQLFAQEASGLYVAPLNTSGD